MISVLILTKNEEENIASCIDAVKWSNDIVVCDSYSSDETTDIARDRGARVVQRRFDNWSTHQNWAVQNIEFQNEWVLYLDADERCDEELVEELRRLSQKHPDRNECAAFQVRRKDFFMGKWLRHAQIYPTWLTRVFVPSRIRYERLVNPVAVVDGEVRRLKGHLLHQPFSHGVTHWYSRHNRYSDLEAMDLERELKTLPQVASLLSSSPTDRRRALKRLGYSVPGRPLWMLFYLLLWRRGFLDGIPGVYYCAMRASYELMIDIKVREARWKRVEATARTGELTMEQVVSRSAMRARLPVERR